MNAATVIDRYRNRIIAIVTAALLSLCLIFAPHASAVTIAGPSDCDSNAIINCGAHSTAALKQSYNSSSYVQKVYAWFGISGAEMANLGSTDIAGRVTRDGRVFIDSQSDPVATNAITGGRQNMPGSTPVNAQGATFYARPPSVSFQQGSLPAFVSMKNGSFQFAVIASCGNAVKATPTAQPKAAVAPARAVSRQTPQPQPKPVAKQVQQQQQSQQANVTNTNTQTVQTAPQTTTTTNQPATQPASLVNTGPSGAVGAFVASTLAGVWGYRRFVLRRIAE